MRPKIIEFFKGYVYIKHEHLTREYISLNPRNYEVQDAMKKLSEG